jgi:sulfonate transport system substrate-binding protein
MSHHPNLASSDARPLRADVLRLAGVRWLMLASILLGIGCQRGREANETSASASSNRVLRVVRAKQLSALSVLEKQGTLDRALAPLGFRVQWLEFLAGPQQLEALNAGALDLAATAESPVVFSQAAGADLVYVATTPPSGRSVALLVPRGSNARRISDLKGKRIAFQKASVGHYLLVKALQREGLSLADVQPVHLTPPDANAAFSAAQIDGWLIWEPYVTRTVASTGGRVLFDGEALRDTGNFYTTSRSFAQAHPDVLKVFLAELSKAEQWSAKHPSEMSQLLSAWLMIDVPTLQQMHAKYDFRLLPITPQVITKQQEVADLWFGLGLLPAKVDVRKGFLAPAWYADLIATSAQRPSS